MRFLVRPACVLLPLLQIFINRPPDQLANRGACLSGELVQGLQLLLAEIDVSAFDLSDMHAHRYTLPEKLSMPGSLILAHR